MGPISDCSETMMLSMEGFDLKKFFTSWRGMCILAVLVLAVLICVPAWQVERVRVGQDQPVDAYRLATLEDEYRRTLAQILAGCGLLVGLYLTWRRIVATEENVRVAQETVRVAEEGHITDRFTKAIAQLGDTEMAIRLGGIYALERLAKDSETDHGPIMEVLTAYVRENAPRQEEDPQKAAEKPPTDIQAILTVIVRRETTGKNRGNDPLDLNHTRLTRANLSEADLRGANLYEADLRGADLTRATLGGGPLLTGGRLDDAPLLSPTNLAGVWPPPPVSLNAVNLTRANLRGARLGGSNLTGSNLSEADLTGADLRSANLRGADLSGANLTRADLMGARLGGADLTGADLSGANLSWASLFDADLLRARLNGDELPGAGPLMGASLSEAKNLTAEQVQSAQDWRDAFLPEDLQYLKDIPEPPAPPA